MKTTQYFTHARGLGNFRAVDALALAREAAELDRQAEIKRVAAPVVVWHEVMPDDSSKIRASNGVTVY